jgi:hypothetical protein
MPQSFGADVVLVDVHSVIDQIAVMERAVPRNAATQFAAGPLKGLWHSHWSQASGVPDHLANDMAHHGGSLVFEWLTQRYGPAGWSSQTIDREMVDLLAHASVSNVLDHRAGNIADASGSRLTGEWIVYAKDAARNVYLTLGGHNETDEAILARCLPAQREFNELAILQPFSMH